MEPITFVGFPKIARLNRDIVVTEKIDGTNAQIYITEEGNIYAGSRTRWIYPGKADNYGFAGWVSDNTTELLKLGPGHHFGEWWGAGIQRRYNQTEKWFSLFQQPALYLPVCCRVVPVLYRGVFRDDKIKEALYDLRYRGSVAALGFDKPEGIVVYHTAANVSFKVTLENDDQYKGPQP